MKDKIAIVTGANSGMGLATVEALSDKSIAVIDRDTGFGKTITGLLKPFFQTPAEGARTAIFLTTDDSVRNITGGYFYKCKIAKSSRRSKDPELAGRLYSFSEELVNAGTKE